MNYGEMDDILWAMIESKVDLYETSIVKDGICLGMANELLEIIDDKCRESYRWQYEPLIFKDVLLGGISKIQYEEPSIIYFE